MLLCARRRLRCCWGSSAHFASLRFFCLFKVFEFSSLARCVFCSSSSSSLLWTQFDVMIEIGNEESEWKSQVIHLWLESDFLSATRDEWTTNRRVHEVGHEHKKAEAAAKKCHKTTWNNSKNERSQVERRDGGDEKYLICKFFYFNFKSKCRWNKSKLVWSNFSLLHLVLSSFRFIARQFKWNFNSVFSLLTWLIFDSSSLSSSHHDDITISKKPSWKTFTISSKKRSVQS